MTPPRKPSVSVCICTYKRPRFLKRLLHELAGQQTSEALTYTIVVADNDPGRSGEPIVREFQAQSLIPTIYCVQPEQNIALTRNHALAHAQGDFIAFIDDDEFPAKDWLAILVGAIAEYGAAGVLGPVRPFFEQEPPKWLIQGRFCERPELESGTKLRWRDTRTGNVLFKRSILAGVAEPFNPLLGNGGEDQDFFRRMMEFGHQFFWCNEAVVHEVVPPARWTRAYMLKRALLRGQNERLFLNFQSVAKSLIAVPAYTLLLPFLLFGGHHRFMSYLIKLMDHTGKLLAVLGLKPLGSRYISG